MILLILSEFQPTMIIRPAKNDLISPIRPGIQSMDKCTDRPNH